MLHRSVRIAACLAALSMAAAPAAHADRDDAAALLPSDPRFTAFEADGTSLTGRLDAIDEAGTLRLTTIDGQAATIRGDLLEKLERVDAPSEPGSLDPSLIILPDGDRIRGIIDRADDRSLAIRSTRLGAFELPLEAVLGFTLGTGLGPGPERELWTIVAGEPFDSDLILFENGDRRPATFSSIEGAQLAYRRDDREAKLPRASVEAVALDPSLSSYPEPEGRSLDVLLDDGSRMRLIAPEILEDRVEGRTRFGGRVGAELAAVRSAYVIGGAASYLSDREPAREISVPYLGPSRPARTGLTVLGEPLTVGGRVYPRGIGTQSRSLLAYPIAPGERLFRASVALDDASYPLGDVVVRVLVDAEERFASGPITSGSDPVPVEVDVTGGRFLILATEYGRGGGIRDYADWLEARLIR